MGEAVTAHFPALREWASTCDAIARGEQTLLIRKGGISEGSGGFTVEAQRFALIPTVFHQKHGAEAPPWVTVSVVCEVVATAEVGSNFSLAGLAGFHRYEEGQLASRVNYKPEKPLTLIAVRGFRLRSPVDFDASVIRPVCRSWLELPIGEADLELVPVGTELDEGLLVGLLEGIKETR